MHKDPLLRVEVLGAFPNPQQMSWLAAKQDYSSAPIYTQNSLDENENFCGEQLLKMLLAGGKGHFGCLEHPQIIFNWCYVPQPIMSQARTHRVGVSFDVQSFRYTSKSILSIDSYKELEMAFYFRPVGYYTDRQGKKYEYTEEQRNYDISFTCDSIEVYKEKIEKGMSEEHARDSLTTNYRQHAVVSFNCRSLMHFLDLRSKKDAQVEIQWLSELMLEKALVWMPEIFSWYRDNRWSKAKLAP